MALPRKPFFPFTRRAPAVGAMSSASGGAAAPAAARSCASHAALSSGVEAATLSSLPPLP